MYKVFKASNGVEIRDAGWRLEFRRGSESEWRAVGDPSPGSFDPGFLIGDALAEFFQHKRDEELGRWRWPENPDYVVYPQHPEGGGRPDSFRVLQESTGYTWSYDLEHLGDTEGVPWDAARAYFDAHPEPKPWHYAKPGEAWIITVDGKDYAVVSGESNFFESSEFCWRHSDPEITAGRRIYPEGE